MVGSQQYTMVVNDHNNDEETMQIQTGSTIYNWNGTVFILSLIHISEPTRRYAISYAVFCLKKK